MFWFFWKIIRFGRVSACFSILSNISESESLRAKFWHENHHTHSYFFHLNHQRFPKTFLLHEKIVFLWTCFEKRLLKPLEVIVFSLKMTYFGYKNGPLRAMAIFKLEIFFKILVENLIGFQNLFIYFEKLLDLVELCLLLYLEWHFRVRNRTFPAVTAVYSYHL